MEVDLRQFETFLAPEFLTCGRCCKLLPRSALGCHILFCCDRNETTLDLFFEDFKGKSISSQFKRPTNYCLADARFTRVLISPKFVSVF